MARPARALLLAAGLVAARSQGSGDVSGAELRRRLDDLRRELNEGGSRLDGVGRRLTSTKSIYTDSPGKTPYSAEEKRQGALGHMWLLLCGAMVFFMTCGIAMLKAGSSRVKNVQHVFVHCLWDVCIGTIAWWTCGWAFANTGPYDIAGRKELKVMGYESFAGHNFLGERASDGQVEPTDKMVQWFFTWAVSVIAISIAGGGVAERNFLGCAIHSLFSVCAIFPFIFAFYWGRGWVSELNSTGGIDTAGSCTIQVTAGFSALAGAIISGARPGRFDGLTAKERIRDWPEEHTPHSQPLIVFGTLTAWFGWYGLNCGCVGWTLLTTVERGMLSAQVAMNTTIAAAVGGLTAFIVQFALKRKNDVDGLCFGILGGLAAISAGCASVESGSAAGIGAAAGVLYPLASALLKILKVDDPVDAWAVHGVCGLWGLVAAPLLDWGTGFTQMHGNAGFRCNTSGGSGCYNSNGFLNVLATNGAFLGATIAWAFGVSAIIFGILRLGKCMRHNPDDEEVGIDKIKHIPDRAYNFGIPNSADISLNAI